MTTVEVRTESMATGGEAVARDDTGRVIFVQDALPGELVRAELLDEHDRFAHAQLIEVLEASPERREPPCPHVARGCGGCGWQHAELTAQHGYKLQIVRDSLMRLGRVPDPLVEFGPALPDTGFRTTLRMLVQDGQASFRRARSHDPIPVDSCLVAHPLLEELVTDGYFGNAREVTLRAGAATGERLVLVSPNARGVQVPDDVIVVGTDEVHKGRHAWIHEEVAGRRWRISASSFFQARPDGAAVLVDEVHDAVNALVPDDAGAVGTRSLIDLYCGVGLLGGVLAERLAERADAPWQVLGVERHRPAVADARHNLADLNVKLVRASLEAWRPSPADVVVADPARAGLGKVGVARTVATGASGVVLVSCDPASLGRDAGLLAAAGYRFERARLVDLFPHTPHVEVVSSFRLVS